MRKAIMATMVLALATGGPAAAADQRQARGEAELAKELAGRVPGKPVSCLPLARIESSHVFEGTAILYRAFGGVLYVNRLSGADMLRDDDIPVQILYGSQMCRLDQIRLVDRSSRIEHGFANLGDFVPYTKPKVVP